MRAEIALTDAVNFNVPAGMDTVETVVEYRSARDAFLVESVAVALLALE
jgi:hypothetical protein